MNDEQDAKIEEQAEEIQLLRAEVERVAAERDTFKEQLGDARMLTLTNSEIC